MHNFLLVNADTDSIMFTKEDMAWFSEDEQEELLEELNSLFPEKICWENDGIYDDVLVLKAKNYVLRQDNKIKHKGSALMDQKKEPALSEFLRESCLLLMDDKKDDVLDLYKKYVKEACNITDISRWAVKKTVTEKVLENDRLNERKVRDAIGNTSVQEGDKIWIYTAQPVLVHSFVKGEQQFKKDGSPKFKEDSPLKLTDNWIPGDEDRFHYIDRVHKTAQILENLIDIEQFVKYNNKKNRYLLEDL